MVDIDVEGDVFNSIVLETPSSAPYLRQGSRVVILFKETEVSIAKNLCGMISLRNRFKGTVKRVENSGLLSKISLEYKNTEIISIISSRSSQKLMLAQADEVEWLVKANEVSLSAGSGIPADG